MLLINKMKILNVFILDLLSHCLEIEVKAQRYLRSFFKMYFDPFKENQTFVHVTDLPMYLGHKFN